MANQVTGLKNGNAIDVRKAFGSITATMPANMA
jgi:hypothetical protein